MKPWVLETVIVAASLAVWVGVYGLMMVITRPRPVHAGPASQDLGSEPPAVVSLLANGWEVTEDAVESTLLDLGARKYYEFRQPANDPMQTTIHLSGARPAGNDLTPYERSVYERVTGLAQNGLVPLTALTFRDDSQAKAWWKTVKNDRHRGRPAARPVAATVRAAGVGRAVVCGRSRRHRHRVRGLPQPAPRPHPQQRQRPGRHRPGRRLLRVRRAGRDRRAQHRGARHSTGEEVASRWLGLKQWLRGNDGFADLPPASVAVWDRYLGYGAALGTTRVASAVIDMGMGNRRRVWSSFGGTWHRVRVSYPRFWPRYGHPWGKLVFRGVLAGGIGAALVKFWKRGLSDLSTVDFVHGRVYDRVAALIAPIGYALGFVLLAYGAYVLIRVLIDAVAPRTTTGQLLWVRVWRTRGGGENSPAVPWLYYAAIDDGSGDRTRAWGLPADLERRCDTGDTVTVTIRRWSRRVVALELTQRGAAAFTSSAVDLPRPAAPVSAAPAGLLSAFLGGGGSTPSSALLRADEVSQALGVRVSARPGPAMGPMAMTTFVTDPRGKTVLMMQVMRGGLVEAMWNRGIQRARGQQIPGIGDGAWVDGYRGGARSGDTFVAVTLAGPARKNPSVLPALLSQAVARIPRQSTPVDS